METVNRSGCLYLDHVVSLTPEDTELVVRCQPKLATLNILITRTVIIVIFILVTSPACEGDPLLPDLVAGLESGQQQLLPNRRLLNLSPHHPCLSCG